MYTNITYINYLIMDDSIIGDTFRKKKSSLIGTLIENISNFNNSELAKHKLEIMIFRVVRHFLQKVLYCYGL